jgi:hypothetical protein
MLMEVTFNLLICQRRFAASSRGTELERDQGGEGKPKEIVSGKGSNSLGSRQASQSEEREYE